jgi:hypothetical protein
MDSITSYDPSDSEIRDFVIAALGVEFFMLLFFAECTVYDLSTAMCFAYGLGFLARGHVKAFYLLYPVASLNRESAFLLTAFFVVFYVWRLPAAHYVLGVGYQCLVFALLRWTIVTTYAGNGGAPFYFWPGRVLYGYENQMLGTITLLVSCAVFGYFVYRNWRSKPAFLRAAFLILFPLLLIMHLTMGMAFEIRVFAEVFPVAWALLWT